MRLSPVLLCATLLVPAALPAAVDYLTQVKPLLQTHCVKCHGASTQKAGLRLDTAAAARKGGGRGSALATGQPDTSLLLQVVTGSHNEIPQMPYKRGPLDSAQIDLLRQWVREGAAAPADEKPSDDRHWAYLAPVRAPVPKVAGAPHPIDAFVQDRLARAGLKPSPPAAPETRLRRLALDLTGLPPSPEEIDRFLATGDEAAEVERRLGSAAYGERWGRWWLDQARYADSNGYSIDAPRSIWPYRDWVIRALNADQPFDQFTIEQLAGDLLPGATKEQLVATGFHRNTQINQEGGIDKEQFRIESVFDRVATTGTVWLGLTIACAQCHDHKFDALSQREYYELFAFFNNQDEPTLTVPDPGQDADRLKSQLREVQSQLDTHVGARLDALATWEAGLNPTARKALPKATARILAKPAAQRSAADRRTLFKAMTGTGDPVFNPLYDRQLQLEESLSKGVTTLVLKERAEARRTTVFTKGDFTRPAEEVTPATPAVLPPLGATKPNRLDLARWLVRRDNPLTARVIVNRVWQQYFGRGLVETENDFGTMGTLPTHPELLDWLAVEFMENGWSLKHLHRLIVTSATYRQSSTVGAEARIAAAGADPDNRLLWRQNRLRLDAEIVRDVGLAASGLLAPKLGGPPVYPPIPEGVMSLGQVKRAWPVSVGEDRYRRGLYTFVFRATPPPGLSVFDAPDGFSTCTRRLRSNTPLQALTLLNDAAFVEFAQALEQIVRKDGIDTAFRRCTARRPSAEERASLAQLTPFEAARVLLNLDETITRE
jgi:mono/diheme cytochrome c family protein